ncbi:ArnT family glycosyltransferase [Cognatiluteimonas profundi]|uniref:ArnT family glycosyltransferase n=1 Tax=Cognatiluteimonas profundi TaxID=2594501 RepID=UPI00131CA3D1|nr:hypothetical protein [Lysobacter profundi]
MRSSHVPANAAEAPSVWAGVGVLLAYACLRVALLWSVPLNSDEPQHAHVAWALSRGLVPYRDVFDNHAPLFHLLYAPLLAVLGETPDVMAWLRLAIIPLAVAAIGLTMVIAGRLWSRKTGLWAILLLCAFPPYMMEVGTFRTDAMWAVAWIGAVAWAVHGRWTLQRAFWFGVLVGTTFAVSMKTLLLLSGLALTWSFVVAALPAAQRPSLGASFRSLGAALSGAAIVPALVVGWVAAKGGLAAMRYGVIEHNILPDVGRTHGIPWRLPLMILAIGLLAFVVRKVIAGATDKALSARRCLVAGSAVAYTLLLLGIWPLLSRQDLLPSAPLLALGLAAWLAGRRHPAAAWLPTGLAIAGLAWVGFGHPPWENRLAQEHASLADILATTTDRDQVMDDKGASIFRMRPFYFALEDITLARIRRGLIKDDIQQRLLATDTHLVWARRLSPMDARFVAANYLPARDGLMVAGHDFGWLHRNAVETMQVLLPGFYALDATSGPGQSGVLLDGSAYVTPRLLAAGPHALSVAQAGRYALVWQPAQSLLSWREH